MNHSELIHDWNKQANGFDYGSCRVVLNDETLRDGLQSPSVIDPPMEAKVRLLHLMAGVGVRAADIGLPGAGPRVVEQVRILAREIVDQHLPIDPNCVHDVAGVENFRRTGSNGAIRLTRASK